MTPDEIERAERNADAEWQRQMHATSPEQRSHALYVAIRAFQAALARQGADVTDYLAACHLLDQALDEYGAGLEAGLDPIN
jgi:hypothetical protein